MRNDIYGDSSLEITTVVSTEHEDTPNSYTIEDSNVQRIVRNVAYETTDKPSRAEYEIPAMLGEDHDVYSHLEH